MAHDSVQSNPLHLIIDALRERHDERLTGKVWRDRYHARKLTTSSEVGRALVYVLQNERKHGFELLGPFTRRRLEHPRRRPTLTDRTTA